MHSYLYFRIELGSLHMNIKMPFKTRKFLKQSVPLIHKKIMGHLEKLEIQVTSGLE